MAFKDALFEAMTRLNLTQAQACRLTGVGKSSMSQYLSGKNVPSEARQKDIAQALGLPDDYFKTGSAQDEPDDRIPRLTVAQAAAMMGLSRVTVAHGLQDGVFPWGYAIRGTGEGFTYWINKKRFLEIEMGVK